MGNDIVAKLGSEPEQLTAAHYKTQVVAGKNYFVRVTLVKTNTSMSGFTNISLDLLLFMESNIMMLEVLQLLKNWLTLIRMSISNIRILLLLHSHTIQLNSA